MRQAVKRAIERLFGRLGYAVIPHWRLERHSMARHLARLFRELSVDLVLDVGANRGQYHDFLRREVGYAGWIASFEPNPALANHLAARARVDDRWAVHGCALGSAPGMMEFNIMASSEFSSFLQPTERATSRFAEMNRVAEQVTVEVDTLERRLPALMSSLAVCRPYLKLDTQGFDLSVIEGARGVLAELEALQIEASVTPIYEAAPDYATAIATSQSLGFEPSGFFPNNEGHFPRLVEFDCVMVARRHVR